MGRYAASDLGTNNGAARQATCDAWLAESRSIYSSPEYSFASQHLESPTDASTCNTINKNDANGDDSRSIDKNLVDIPDNNYRDISTTLFVASSRPMSLPQLSHFPAYHHNATAPPNSMCSIPYDFRHNTYFLYHNDSIRTPVEAAINKQINKLITGISPNYLGDPYLVANQSANIHDELNTSVWITNLPPDTNHKTLLGCVRNCGKVIAAVINGPEGSHFTAAAKIVFADVAGAQELLRQAHNGEFIVNNFVPRVLPNRIKTAARPPGPNSRVLHIEGPNCIVNQSYLEALFHGGGITWQDEEVIILSNNGIFTRLEWRFGSYRCQAESVRYLIERVKRHTLMPVDQIQAWQGVTVHFGVDPCAPKPGNYATVTYIPLTDLHLLECTSLILSYWTGNTGFFDALSALQEEIHETPLNNLAS